MRRIALWMMSTTTVLVLLFGYRTSTQSVPVAAASSAVTAPAAGSTASGSSAAPSSSDSAESSAAAGETTTYTGASASTRWGDVQVAITVSGGQITAVTVPVYPSGKDQQINASALPVLVQETLQAQSADIDVDMVSGATVTSEGYLQSLQSALDQAGL